jgi:hypothetical protein
MVHLQPIERDHVIHETNGVGHLQNFFAPLFLFKLPQDYNVSPSLKQMYASKKMFDEFEDKSIVLSITIFCFK